MSNHLRKHFRIYAIASVVLLSVLHLIAVTLGLFTSSSSTLIHASGASVKIDLLQANDEGVYTSIKNSNGEVFGDAEWEPGQARVVFLKVKSESTIRVKYSFQLKMEGDEVNGAFQYFAYEGDYFDIKTTSYDELVQSKTPQMLSSGMNPLTEEQYIYMEPGEEHDYVLVLRMSPEATNVYQGKSCTIDINVLAVQGNKPTT